VSANVAAHARLRQWTAGVIPRDARVRSRGESRTNGWHSGCPSDDVAARTALHEEDMMRSLHWSMIPVVLAAAAACSKSAPQVDDALSRDLSLASTAPAPAQQFVSPAELGYGQYPQAGYAQQPQGYAPYPQAYPQPYPQQTRVVYQPAPRPRVVYRGSAGSAGSVGTVTTEPVRHTKRDAMIGVGVGTITGAMIGKDAKGALIGAAAGGLIGAVVGHTIDVSH
jgi:hypothetical protein